MTRPQAQKIKELENELTRLDPARQLDSLLTEITSADRYERYRGLTGRIHHDLKRLSDHMSEAQASSPALLQRIILYVDDLDRCVSGRVVEVLQAVNLLLSMPLFVVVVAVDPRWLLRAVEDHHGLLLNAKPTDHGRPLDYLDKIFHIPYAVRPMNRQAEDFLRRLLPEVEEPQAAEQPETPQRGDATRTPAPESPSATDVMADIADVATGNVASSTVVPPPPSQIRVEALRLRRTEADFLPCVASLLRTPRAIKKLSNLYRLLRISIPDTEIDSFIGDDGGGPYQAATLLLAAIVSAPGEAEELLVELGGADPSGDIVEVLQNLGNGQAIAHRLAALIEAIRRTNSVHGDTATYQSCARTVARYSFETYELFTGNQ